MIEESTREPPTFERPGGLLSKVDGHVVMYHNPHSLQAEQYRACRSNLTAMNRSGAPWALAVTSSRKGEGKSFTAANLAACLAELPGTRVCLVDTDSRASSQSEIFGLGESMGLTELVLGQVSVKDVVRRTVIDNLDLIGSGGETENPAELLGSDRFVEVVEDLKRRYSWIVLDTPPVHPYTDACVVSALVNGALIVVKLQDTPREIVNRTIENIVTAGGRVMGTFLTGLTPDRDDAERLDYYHPEKRRSDSGDAQRRRAHKLSEKRMREQELAYLKRQRRDEDPETPV